MILSQVAAMSKNRVIGKENTLPWHLPEDQKFFRKVTTGKIMIMGRKTFESLPGHLPNRYHIVISRNSFVADEGDVSFVRTIDEALTLAKKLLPKYDPEVCIIGGGEIYKQMLPVTDKIYLTVIEKEFEGDAWFPEFSENDFLLVDQTDRPGPPAFSFRTYVRRK